MGGSERNIKNLLIQTSSYVYGVNNKTWALVRHSWLLGGGTTKTMVWFYIRIKDAKTLFNKIFLNFDISDKKLYGQRKFYCRILKYTTKFLNFLNFWKIFIEKSSSHYVPLFVTWPRIVTFYQFCELLNA